MPTLLNSELAFIFVYILSYKCLRFKIYLDEENHALFKFAFEFEFVKPIFEQKAAAARFLQLISCSRPCLHERLHRKPCHHQHKDHFITIKSQFSAGLKILLFLLCWMEVLFVLNVDFFVTRFHNSRCGLKREDGYTTNNFNEGESIISPPWE